MALILRQIQCCHLDPQLIQKLSGPGQIPERAWGSGFSNEAHIFRTDTERQEELALTSVKSSLVKRAGLCQQLDLGKV